eukprot:TRINITY_DN62199_c0_g1_i1.p1 TRINITY_DN62199_c0_g1~~TRINITY_DN62199_c0_g1_i1.p1  ORF type:complete len:462 (+),score=53.49 TRINITY_DN62199_c0_g1_i1:236-1621(+)
MMLARWWVALQILAQLAIVSTSWGAHHRDYYGNTFCWYGELSFDACCVDEVSECWDNSPYNYDDCCWSGDADWMTEGSVTRARVNVVLGHYTVPALVGNSGCSMQLAKLGWHESEALWSPRRSSNRLSIARCKNLSGDLYVVMPNGLSELAENETFLLCAPRGCSGSEVAADLFPFLLRERFRGRRMTVLQATLIDQVGFSGSPDRIEFGVLGHPVPPGRSDDLSEFVQSFRICGRCVLEFLGSDDDGGYSLCRVGLGIAGAYSFGIAGSDDWGTAVSKLTGATVYQYDCFDSGAPDCPPPSKCVFRPVCVVGVGKKIFDHADRPLPASTLQKHLHESGHANVSVGRLLLKMDIEGSEWEVFDSLDETDLQKFLQINVEFHLSRHYASLVDAPRLALQLRVMRKLLTMFVVVFVNINPACDRKAARCVEVTFARSEFVKKVQCSEPDMAKRFRNKGGFWSG